MNSREDKQVERMNDEFFGLYRCLRDEGKRMTPAVETAAAMCGCGASRAWEIGKIKEGETS
jgi:hypothetical protein